MTLSDPTRIAGGAVVAGVVITIIYFTISASNLYVQSIVVLIGIYYLLATSLNVVVGYTDLISFGQAAFFGIGAYAAALTAVYLSGGLLLGALIGVVLAIIFAVVVASASRRLSGVYFALATLAAAEILRIILLNWRDFTRGPLGLNIPLGKRTLVPGLPITRGAFLPLIFIVVVITTSAMIWLIRSDIGKRMVSVRENPALAASIGVAPATYRMIAFCVSGCIGAVAGAIYAFNYGILTPDISGLNYSSLALLMVILGGRGTLLGPFVGAAVFVLVPQWVNLNGALSQVVFAIILFLAVLLMPNGVVGSLRGFIEKRAGVRRTKQAAPGLVR